eukprot:m.4688 g.4688  ORF g.4688 m.4688 type:complete len:120 (+) comp2444_c0_seq2:751-1110(+)
MSSLFDLVMGLPSAFVGCRSLDRLRSRLPLDDLLDTLEAGKLVIILADARYLAQESTGDALSREDFRGHFVVLNGVSRSARLVFYLDPSLHKTQQQISLDQLELARSSFGTDDDLLIIS